MDTSDLHTDGNAIGGLLQQIFVTEMTTARRVCDGCGEEHAIGAHRAYTGAGIVLRCPGCDAVAATLSVLAVAYVGAINGVWRMAAAV
jgi:hypothetical protein